MIIFTNSIAPRLEYTFDFVFKETLGVDYIFETNREKFETSNHIVKWAYNSDDNMESPFLPAVSLLFEETIEPQKTVRIQSGDIIPIFHSKSGVGFDIFASIFYLISRYEEYVPCIKDKHNRYAGLQSIAMTYGFIELAMVNRYIFWIAEWLSNNFPTVAMNRPKSHVIFSIDIDHPFYSKDISLDKFVLRSIKSFSLFQEKDRNDTFDFILDNLGEIPSIFFFLCPKNPEKEDHFNKRESENFKNLIYYIKTKSRIGIHPSYFAEDRGLLEEEISWLSAIHGRAIKSNRFHYLKNDVESSYSKLLDLHIKYDFSMAYGDICGFRSGTSFPFYFFDLRLNKKQNLIIYTPCIMDSCFEYGNQANFESRFKKLYDEVTMYGGTFMPIFHNDIMSKEEWKNRFLGAVKLVKNEV